MVAIWKMCHSWDWLAHLASVNHAYLVMRWLKWRPSSHSLPDCLCFIPDSPAFVLDSPFSNSLGLFCSSLPRWHRFCRFWWFCLLRIRNSVGKLYQASPAVLGFSPCCQPVRKPTHRIICIAINCGLIGTDWTGLLREIFVHFCHLAYIWSCK